MVVQCSSTDVGDSSEADSTPMGTEQLVECTS